jgi:hypothetical protein
MNIIKIIVVFCMVHISSLEAQQLSDYNWKNRIVILSDNAADFKNAVKALKTISAFKKELNERDIILFLYRDGKLYDTDLNLTAMNTSNTIPKAFTGYLLIGKDGGIKSKERYPIDPEQIFTLIDGMPMRRAEMKSDN